MTSTALINSSYIIWVCCVAAAVICLVVDVDRSRKIRKWLRNDYGEECCMQFHTDSGHRSSDTSADAQGEEEDFS